MNRDELIKLTDDEIESKINDYVIGFLKHKNIEEDKKLLKSLPEVYQNAYLTSIVLEGEVFNGGFLQFFYNSSGQFYEEILSAYQVMALNDVAKIVENAFNKLMINIDTFKKSYSEGTLEAFSGLYKEIDLSEFDKQMYSIFDRGQISKRRHEYIRKNI